MRKYYFHKTKFIMKTLNNSNHGLKTFHFCIIGSSFLIVVLSCLFLLNSDNYMKNQSIHSYEDLRSFVDLREHYKMIEDEVVYDFLNQVFFDKGTVLPDTMKWNLYCFTIPHSKELKSFITNLSNEFITKTNKDFIKSQLDTTRYLWDNKKLNNARCLSPKDYYEVRQNVTTDYWVKYRANFGYGGNHSFSKPIFNSDRNLVVIEYTSYFDLHAASNDILLYKKENEKWILVKHQNIWIS